MPPQWSHNVQLAIWASVPLGLMAALQLVYFFAGGTAGEPGMAGLLSEWDAYADLPASQQALALSFASRLTLFSLWTVALVYIGGRQTLRGPWLALTLATLALVALVVAIPVVAGTITAPDDEAAPGQPGEMIGPDMMPGELGPGEFPPGAESGEMAPGGEAPGMDALPDEGMPGNVPPGAESGEMAPGGEAPGMDAPPDEGMPGDVPPADGSGEAAPGDGESGANVRPEEAPSGESMREDAPPAEEPAAPPPDAIEVAPERVQ